MESRWSAAAIVFAAALILFNRLVFQGVDYLFGHRGWIYTPEKGPTNIGIAVHALVLLFVTFGILSIDWAVE